ncbi:LLM class flavin-dependent oxidoreductase [Streptomyces sp. M19]
MRIVKKAWTTHEPFDHEGEHYRFHDFVSDVFPVRQPRRRCPSAAPPRGVRGGRRRGGRLRAVGRAVGAYGRADRGGAGGGEGGGRSDSPRIQVAFRPIIAPTEELAWEKAHRTVGAIRAHRERKEPTAVRHHRGDAPQNAGSQRLIAIAEAGERYDRALWTPTAAATGGAGNSNALVGTPETVAQALLDYYDLGVDIISARGYDLLGDAIDFGRHVIPIVREEVAKRDAERAERGPQTLTAVR